MNYIIRNCCECSDRPCKEVSKFFKKVFKYKFSCFLIFGIIICVTPLVFSAIAIGY